jgi:protein tyrosine phosphatase (PTP) superfamily phosphohydrolase (DUF442 family)
MWLVQWLKSTSTRNEFRVPISNFGKVTDALYRGALPDTDGYRALSERLGVRRVCCMMEQTTDEDRRVALDSGVEEWRHIPFSDRAAPRPESVREWLAHVRTAEIRGPLFTHCRGGRHRTGVLVATLRVTDCGWTREQALDEMLRYGWYGARGHRPLLEWFLREFDPKDYAVPGAPAVGQELKDLSQSA